MALKPCRECKKEVSTEAEMCPRCGAQRPTEAPAPVRVPAQGVIGCVVLAAVMLLAIGYCNANTPEKSPTQKAAEASGAVKMDARIVCEDFVKRRLKAPSTAKVHVAGTTDQAVSDLGGGKWRVKGYFDSQNSFGAMLRGYYVCDVQHTGGDQFNLISLAMQ